MPRAFNQPGRQGVARKALEGRFELGVGTRARDGEELLILTMGSVAAEAAAAAEALSADGIATSLLVVSTLNPIDASSLSECLARYPVVLTVEAHYINGGLGSAVAETIADGGLGCRLLRCGVRSGPDGLTGGASYLHERHGLSREGIVGTARRALITSPK